MRTREIDHCSSSDWEFKTSAAIFHKAEIKGERVHLRRIATPTQMSESCHNPGNISSAR